MVGTGFLAGLMSVWEQAGGREGGNFSPGWEGWQPEYDKHAISKRTKLLKPPTRKEQFVRLCSLR